MANPTSEPHFVAHLSFLQVQGMHCCEMLHLPLEAAVSERPWAASFGQVLQIRVLVAYFGLVSGCYSRYYHCCRAWLWFRNGAPTKIRMLAVFRS